MWPAKAIIFKDTVQVKLVIRNGLCQSTAGILSFFWGVNTNLMCFFYVEDVQLKMNFIFDTFALTLLLN